MNPNVKSKGNLTKRRNIQTSRAASGGFSKPRLQRTANYENAISSRERYANLEKTKLFSEEFKVEKAKVMKKLHEALENFDALISFSTQTRFWLTGFSATEGVSVILLNQKHELEIHAFLDGRYFEAAKVAIKSNNVTFYSKKEDLVEFIRSCNFQNIVLESDYTNLFQAVEIRSWVGRECMLFNMNAEGLRVVKSAEEIEKIQKAVDISLEAYKWVRTSVLFPGVTEEEVARAFSQKMYQLGAEAPAFPPIVAFGANTANPHHTAGSTKLKAGDIVTLDFGAKYKNFCSDITRTFLAPGVSSLEQTKKDELRRIWETVNRAAYIGRETAASGVPTANVDKACRNVIAEEGLGKYFSHGTGHGVGIDIHESPRVTSLSSEILDLGHVFTVEPGVYVPKLGGARVEDTLAINSAGVAKILSRPYLYTSLGSYQREFDLFDINQLLKEQKIGKTILPVKSQANRDFFTLLRIYEEASRLPAGEDNWQVKNFRDRFTDSMVSVKKSPFSFKSEEKEGEFGPRPFRISKPQSFDSVRVQPLSEVLEQIQVEGAKPRKTAQPSQVFAKKRGRRPKVVLSTETQQTPSVPQTESQGPVIGAKRGRGRPKRVVTPQPTVEVVAPTAPKPESQQAPRRRGRPKRVVAAPSEVGQQLVTPIPQKRGRKPKVVLSTETQQTPSVPQTESQGPVIGAKRGRGRPKRVVTPQPTVEVVAPTAPKPESQQAPRRRGRPKRVVAAPSEVGQQLVTPIPQKRGRKPKVVLSTETQQTPSVPQTESQGPVIGAKRGRGRPKRVVTPQPTVEVVAPTAPKPGFTAAKKPESETSKSAAYSSDFSSSSKAQKPAISSPEPVSLSKKKTNQLRVKKESGSLSSKRKSK